MEPSGDTAATWLRVRVKFWPWGSTIENRPIAAGGAGFNFHAAIPARALKRIAVSSIGIASFHKGCRVTMEAVGAVTARGAFAMISNSALKSPAACQRRFGFF